MRIRLIIIIIISTAAIALAAAAFAVLRGAPAAPPAGAAPALPPAATQRDQGEGGVAVEVTLVRPGTADGARYGAATHTVFLVAMNTHSVDLGAYDMVRVSELRAGGRRLTALRWISTSDNNHHRAGALVFPQADPSAGLELRIKTIGGIPVRTFRWAP